MNELLGLDKVPYIEMFDPAYSEWKIIGRRTAGIKVTSGTTLYYRERGSLNTYPGMPQSEMTVTTPRKRPATSAFLQPYTESDAGSSRSPIELQSDDEPSGAS